MGVPVNGIIFKLPYWYSGCISEPLYDPVAKPDPVYSNTISKNCPPVGYSRVNKDWDKYHNYYSSTYIITIDSMKVCIIVSCVCARVC